VRRGPDTLAARTELADLIAQAAGGLSDRNRTVLELAYRHGLDGPELANALEVSPGTANRMVSRLRATIETSLGALLVARRAQHAAKRCTELAAILAGWDGRFSVLMRKRISRHIESCPTCEDERRRLVNPVALLGGAPVFIPAPAWLRDQTLGDIKLTSAGGALTANGADSSPDADGRHDQDYLDDGRPRDARELIPWNRAGLRRLFLALMLTIALFYHHNTAVSPTQLSKKRARTHEAGRAAHRDPQTAHHHRWLPGEHRRARGDGALQRKRPRPCRRPKPPRRSPRVPPPPEPPPIAPPPPVVVPPPVIAPPPVLVPPPVVTPAAVATNTAVGADRCALGAASQGAVDPSRPTEPAGRHTCPTPAPRHHRHPETAEVSDGESPSVVSFRNATNT